MRSILKEQIKRFQDESCITFADDSELFEYYCSHLVLKGNEVMENQIKSSIVDGSYDEGIDSIFITIDNKLYTDTSMACDSIRKTSKIIFYFIQSKQEDSFKESVLMKIQKGIKYCFEDSSQLSNELFQKQATMIRAVWDRYVSLGCDKKISVEVYYINQTISSEQAMQNDRIKRELISIEELTNRYGFICKAILLGCKELIEMFKKHGEYRKSLKTLECLDYPESEDDQITGYLAIVSGYDFFKFITTDDGELEEKIFDENIRDFNGDQGVNSKIKITLESDSKRNFWCMNNGITMVGYKKDKKGKNIWLSTYQIINGCQTAHTIYNYMKKLSEEERRNCNFELIVKIIELADDNDELLLKIIDSTNSQTSIDTFAFESHKSIHRMIEQYFLSKTPKTYYERRPNSYTRKAPHSSMITNPQKLLQQMYAIYYKKPSEARNNVGKVFDDNKSEIFNDKNSFDYYWIAHNLVKATDIALANHENKNSDTVKDYIFNSGLLHISRVIFSLIVGKEVKIINKLNCDDLLDIFGGGISELLEENLDVSSYIDDAVEIIWKSLSILNGESKNIANTFRTSGFDTEITKQTALYFQNNTIQEIAVEASLQESNYNKDKIMQFIKVMDSPIYCFNTMSLTGDFRFNFSERKNDIIFWINYYGNHIENKDQFINDINQCCENSDLTNRKSRIETSKLILVKIKDLVEQSKQLI